MIGRSMGVMPTQIPDAYSLKISFEGRDRLVSVEKNMFDSVAVGDEIVVQQSGESISVENADKRW
jgi:hypothetical protein